MQSQMEQEVRFMSERQRSKSSLHILLVFFSSGLSRHLGPPQWSSMVLCHCLLSSAIFLSCPVIWGRRNGHRWFFGIVFCHPPSFFLVPSSGAAAMVIDGSLASSSVIRHLSFLSRHLGPPQWSSMVLWHRLLSSAIFLSCPVIWGHRNGHRWFFGIVFCHPPSSFLVPSSGVAAMASMVLCHRLLSSAIFLSCPVIWGRRNGHRWFFAIVFCHPPSSFLVPSSGVAAMVIDGSLPLSSVICPSNPMIFMSAHSIHPPCPLSSCFLFPHGF